MRRSYHFLVFLLFILLLASSCKEKNDPFPPSPWKTFFYDKPDIPARPVSALLIENDHTFWFGSNDAKGLVSYDGYDWKTMNAATTGIPFDSVTAIVKDGNGTVWSAWKSGLASLDKNGWKLIPELSGRRITSLAVQGIGTLWAGIDGEGTQGGLAKYSQGSWQFYHPGNSSVSSSHISSLSFDQNQHLWIGTYDRGVIRFSTESGLALAFLLNESNDQSISCLVSAHDGSVYAGSRQSHLIHFENGDYTVMSTGVQQPLSSLAEDANGKIWMGTLGAGVLTLADGKWESFTVLNSQLFTDHVLALGKDADGNILVSLSDGHILFTK